MRARTRYFITYICSLFLLLNAAIAVADPMIFRIEAQEASTALTEFAKQSRQQVLFESAKLKGHRTNALSGQFEPIEGLRLLLKGTGLKAVVREGDVITIELEPSDKRSDAVEGRLPEGIARTHFASGRAKVEPLQEVVISAEKRQSTVQSTAISVTAISGVDLEARGITNLVSMAKEAPGISYRTAGPGQTEFEMRGVSSTGGSIGTVGFYLDDTPFTPPSFGAIGKVVIDPNLYDLQSVEVLRGPQGTLYGAGSMGGTIRVLTHQPDLHGFDASADVTGSSTQDGGFNRSGNLMLNIPLFDDKMALRLVASTEYRDGWLDRAVIAPFPEPTNSGCEIQPAWKGCARGDVTVNPASRIVRRVNTERLNTFRPSLLIEPTDDLSISLSALYQRTTMDGYDTVDLPPGCGPAVLCGHYQPFDTPEPFSDLVKLLSGVVRYHTKIASFTSATSIWTRSETQTQDAAEALESAFGHPFTAAPLTETDKSRQLSQELRVTSNAEGPFQWLLGVFYSDFRFIWDQSWYNDTFAGPSNPTGAIYVAHIPYDTKQYAAFTEETYQIAPAWKLSAGLRAFRYQSDSSTGYFGFLTPTGDGSTFYGYSNQSAHGFNPKFSLSYVPSHDLTVYGTASRGFRPGGISELFPASCDPGLRALGLDPSAAHTYGPDSLWNYEVGEKARLMDGRITINSDLYYIRWHDIQQVIPQTCSFILEQNAGNARTYGPELELQAKLTDGLTASLSATYTNAEIDQPKLGLSVAQPLLNIPKYTTSLTLDYRHALRDELTLSAYVAESLVGPQWDTSYSQRQLSSYALTDARLALSRGQWTAALFVNNATNRMAIQTINNTFFSLNIPSLTRATVIQPRTIGVKIAWQLH